jgi:hypothetical protein
MTHTLDIRIVLLEFLMKICLLGVKAITLMM